ALGARHHEFEMAVDPSRADRHNLRLLLFDHLAVVGVGRGGAGAGGRLGTPRFVLVGDGNHLGRGDFLPDGIDPVAVVAAPRAADDADAIFLSHADSLRCKDVRPTLLLLPIATPYS